MRAVIAKSFARIHAANLINFGIVPLVLEDESDYELLSEGDGIYIEGFAEAIKNLSRAVVVNRKNNARVGVKIDFTPRQRAILLAGGLLNYTVRGE